MTREELLKKIEELKKEKSRLSDLANVQDLQQHAYKIFLNSAYGALGSAFYPCYDLDNAESVTLSGQAVTREMVNYTNKILNQLINNEVPDEFVVAGDTDSVAGKSKVYITDDLTKTIEELFIEYKNAGKIDVLKNGTEVAVADLKIPTKSLNGNTYIKNISRHKVKKEKWTITVDGVSIDFTKDHSIMVYRDGKIIECTPENIQKTDYILKKK